MTRINSQKVSKNMSYRINELAKLLSVSEKTILRWIDSGLQTIPGGKKPIYIFGSEIRKYLRNKDAKKKMKKLKRSEFFCLGCKAPRNAKQGSIKHLKNKKTGICRVCGGKMCRIFKSAPKDYMIPPPPTQMSIFDVIPISLQDDKNNH